MYPRFAGGGAIMFELAEADERGLFFGINFNHRYAQPVRMAREAIRQGRLGRIAFATCYFNDADREFRRTFDKHFDAVIDAFRSGREPPVHARAGRRALKLALAAVRAFEEQTTVQIRDEGFA